MINKFENICYLDKLVEEAKNLMKLSSNQTLTRSDS